jgi:hypothetical protein
MARHSYTESGCSCGCPSAAYMRQHLNNTRRQVADLKDMFDLGAYLFVVSDRFKFARRIPERLLRTSLSRGA